MYSEQVETLSISLPAVFVHLINNIAKNKKQSQSQVIQEAVQLLSDREQEQTVIQKQANISRLTKYDDS